MKNITMYVDDVVKVSRGDEVIEVVFTKHDSGRKTHVGVKADQDWKIELFRGGKLIMRPTENLR